MADYTIIRKENTTILLPGGVPAAGVRVWFSVPLTGTQDYVEVPNDQDNATTIKSLIQKKTDDILDLFSDTD